MQEALTLGKMAWQELEDRGLAAEVRLVLLFHPNEHKTLRGMGAKLQINYGQVELTSINDGHYAEEVWDILRKMGVIPEKKQLSHEEESKQEVLNLIANYGRQFHLSLPTQPVPIADVQRLEQEGDLHFGPIASGDNGSHYEGINDALAFLRTQEAEGIVRIDEYENTVIYEQ